MRSDNHFSFFYFLGGFMAVKKMFKGGKSENGENPDRENLHPMFNGNNPCKHCSEKFCYSCVAKGAHNRPTGFMDIPIKPWKKSRDSTYQEWMRRNSAKIDIGNKKEYSNGDHSPQFSWIYQRNGNGGFKRPKAIHSLVKSQAVPNDKKVAKVLQTITKPENNYANILLPGKPGSGKAWTALWLAENAKERNPERNYVYFSPTKKKVSPDWLDGIHGNIDKIPNDSMVIFDEAAYAVNSRRPMSEDNVKIGSQLNIRRHQDKQFIFIAQRPSQVDKNITDQIDMFLLHFYNFNIGGNSKGKLMDELRNYIPLEDNPHKVGFFNKESGESFNFWQPEPSTEEKHNLTKSYKETNMSEKKSIVGNDKDEKDDKVYASFYCQQCGNQWKSNKITVQQKETEGKKPKQCPECQTRKWNKAPEED